MEYQRTKVPIKFIKVPIKFIIYNKYYLKFISVVLTKMFIFYSLVIISLITYTQTKSTSLTIIVNPLSTECVYEDIQAFVNVVMDYQVGNIILKIYLIYFDIIML